ncbi:hypothetical protein ElyMa_006386400 [Elysia marginata]|uniref:Uncharacterized protein n=1 Tax=Elysia marginata TaxID=1093978 RepID=A0AAV4HRE8_9GAST|nr:hypothetical protein ElyMa_006386400 [Elysia marginata]
MAADSVHHSIERELRKCGDVRDWQEYVDTLGKAKCQTVSLESSDFEDWPDLSNRQTINKANYKLASIVVAQFRRGHRSLFYKTSHREDSPFVCADFLKKKKRTSTIFQMADKPGEASQPQRKQEF